MSNIVSRRIKEAMNIRNLKQIDIVKQTGINKGSLSSYIKGIYIPKDSNLNKIAQVLNVDKMWLLGYDDFDNIEKILISTNLKFLRNLNNKTLSDVARICGKTDVAVYYWEKGLREPRLIDVARIARFFNISLDDILLKDLKRRNK